MSEETRASPLRFRPSLGAGIGLRPKHYAAALADGAALPSFLEVVTENFLGAGGRPREVIAEAARRRPIALHGVSLSIGSVDPIDGAYLDRVAALADRVKPVIVSDHLCWTSHGGRHSHDLLPLRFTEAEADRVAARVAEAQARLGRKLLLENVSSYLVWRGSTMTEWDFLAAVAERADCGILLDVNNVFVSATNHGFDAREYLDALPAARVGQIHLAGHEDRGRYLFDTHDAPVPEPVWALYEHALARFGAVPTLVERDGKIPPFEELLAEAAAAQRRLDAIPARERRGPGERAMAKKRASSPAGAGETAALHAALFAAIGGDDVAVARDVRDEGMSANERIAIYASSYRARLHDALLEDFPATEARLGHDRFHALAEEYARANPSTNPDLGRFGAGFAAFLRERDAAAADLAALEWARVEAFHAADAPALEMSMLASVPAEKWPELRFVTHPSLRVVPVGTNADAAWRAADTGEPLPAVERAPGLLRVWREGTTVFHARMDAAEATALTAMWNGGTFESSCALLAASLDRDERGAAELLARHLRDWVADGLLAAPP